MRIAGTRCRQASLYVLAGLLAARSSLSLADSTNAVPTRSVPDRSATPLRLMIERYGSDLEALSRFFPVEFSEKRIARLREFHRQKSQELQATDFDSLDQDSKVDYLLLRNRIHHELSQLDQTESRRNATSELMPFVAPLLPLIENRRRAAPVEYEQAARALSDAVAKIGKTQESLEEKLKLPKESQTNLPTAVVANRASQQIEGLKNALRGWNDFYAGYDPQFTWWVGETHEKLNKKLSDYAGFLRKKLAGFPEDGDPPVIGDPIGRAALIEALQDQFIPYTPEQLIDIANKELAWCEVEMRKAADDLGFAGDWKKALDHVSKIHVEPGKQPALIRELAEESTQFVESHQLVTVPDLCKETWRMEMMSPETQKMTPYFTGGEVISIAYPTANMGFDDKLMTMRGNNIHFARATVHHELIPGHHLQIFMSERYRTHRSQFSTPFLVEGWALYWEMRLWDMNFQRSAEDRVGMLFWRSHRCARILFSLKFHLGQMTAQEAIDFLVDKIGHERRNATAEVRRSVSGGYGPLYQAAYMLGGLQLRALHDEVVGPGKMSEREFHDAVLMQNAIPIEMIRASLAAKPLTRDYVPTWNFYRF
ncbi:MAG TPA: DUF885 family protein [Candidatus Limnocylindria bacterium]|nr:DUF885 family protein [Candidatus Limnocylindria bacterium]